MPELPAPMKPPVVMPVGTFEQIVKGVSELVAEGKMQVMPNPHGGSWSGIIGDESPIDVATMGKDA